MSNPLEGHIDLYNIVTPEHLRIPTRKSTDEKKERDEREMEDAVSNPFTNFSVRSVGTRSSILRTTSLVIMIE